MINDFDFTKPITQHTANADYGIAEVDMRTIFNELILQFLQTDLVDLFNYGTPQLGSGAVVEKFAKKDGLSVLRRGITTDRIMQVIYAEWIGKGGKRGLQFLEFVLTMIWGNDYRIAQVFHSIEYADVYPRFLSLEETEDSFLTSRRYITINKNIDLKEVSELAPTLQRLVPANIVPVVLSEVGNGNIDLNVGVLCAGLAFEVITIE